jgi:hypothetical protein
MRPSRPLRGASGRGERGEPAPKLCYRWPAPACAPPLGEGPEPGEAEEQHRPSRRFRRRGRAEGDVQFAVAASHAVGPDQIREGVIQGAAAPAASAIAPGKGLTDCSERRFPRGKWHAEPGGSTKM